MIRDPGSQQSAAEGEAGKTRFRPFRWLYDRVLHWSGHPRAPAILSALSFAESSFFPIPPDVMLAPMCVARPRLSWRFAAYCTAASVLGGMFGYVLGRWLFFLIEPWLLKSSYYESFQAAVDAFNTWGTLFIVVAAFTPIPYKMATISAGVVGMPMLPFMFGSLAGRGGRFFLVASLARFLGEHAAERMREWVDTIGWLTLLLVLIGLLIWRGTMPGVA